MSFTSFIRDWVVDPIGLLFLLSLFFLICLFWARRSRWLMLGAIIWLCTIVFVSGPRVVNPMLLHYENQFSSQPDCLAELPIVVLGGGIDSRAENAEQLHYLSAASFARVEAGRALAEQFPNSKLWLAGGVLRVVSESAVMAHYLREMGIDDTRIIEENESRNTHENAMNIAGLLNRAELDPSIMLVTSALHMKRAKAVFEKQGLQVCPVAVNRIGIENVPAYALWPQTTALQKFDLLLHEVIAGVTYKMSGKL